MVSMNSTTRIGERTWVVEARSTHPDWLAVRFRLLEGPVLNQRRRTVWRGLHRESGRWSGGGEREACRRWAPELEAALPDIAAQLGVLGTPPLPGASRDPVTDVHKQAE